MIAELLNITEDAVNFIGSCAGICYNSGTTREANIRRAKHCKDSGHLATLRFAYATFRITDISRACSHQLVRHKHLDYLQRSQRYIKELTPNYIYPPDLDKPGEAFFEQAYAKAQDDYLRLIALGYKKEDARMILPNAVTTELIVTGNFQAWQDFIRLRTDKAAQWEIRQVALAVKQELINKAPEIFNDE